MSEPQSPTPEARANVSALVRSVIAGFFNVPADGITDTSVVADIEGWDSVSHVGVILAIEDAIGAEFNVDRITAFQNVGELIDECLGMAPPKA